MNLSQFNQLVKNPELWDLFNGSKDQLTTISRYQDNKNADIMSPKVSEYLINNGYIISYPEGKEFAICLTHDIDDIYPPLSHKIMACLYSLKNLRFDQFDNHLLWSIKGKQYSPYINFKTIMDLERKYNAKSTFYFMTTVDDPIRFRYNIEDISGELSYILESGWEVGLHGGYYSYNNFQLIKQEKQRLERALGADVVGYRNHYLRLKVPDTWDLLEKNGFKYDSTYGYTNVVGFRNGMCHPFKPYNTTANKMMDIYEIPLHIMDSALFEQAKDFNMAWEIAKKMIDKVEKQKGVLTVLWHNDIFSFPFRDKWKMLYEKILKHGYEKMLG